MRERKCVKFNVNIYDDTKFKIIDRMEKRDLINYIWTRLVVLAGKVNLEGELLLSRNIPYTLETLAVEFNREVSQIELSIKTFIDLEMVEITENKVYKVKNFAKHQNIKISKNVEKQDKIEEYKNNKKDEKIIENEIIQDSNKKRDKNTDKVLENSNAKIEAFNIETHKKEKLNFNGKAQKGNNVNYSENEVVHINNNVIIDTNTIEDNVNLFKNNNTNVTENNNQTIKSPNSNKEKSKNRDTSSNKISMSTNDKKIKNKSRSKKKEIINEISVTDENKEIVNFTEGIPKISKDEKVLCIFSL